MAKLEVRQLRGAKPASIQNKNKLALTADITTSQFFIEKRFACRQVQQLLSMEEFIVYKYHYVIIVMSASLTY